MGDWVQILKMRRHESLSPSNETHTHTHTHKYISKYLSIEVFWEWNKLLSYIFSPTPEFI